MIEGEIAQLLKNALRCPVLFHLEKKLLKFRLAILVDHRLVQRLAISNGNKPGSAQVGAISNAQNQQKDFKVSKYSRLQHLTFLLKKVSHCRKN